MHVVKKPKCSCYGGFDCDVCNPVVKNSLTPKTDTPRTDACPYCHSERVGAFWYACDTPVSGPQGVVCEERKARKKAEAEVERLRKEILFSEDIDGVAHEVWAEMKAEVERLKSQLARAVEIAEKIWADCSNGFEHTELAALKGEIK